MKEHERRTSWKVVITYLFVIALCGAMFYYIYNLQGFVQNQKLNIKTQNTALDLTNRFTQLVHEAQNEANLFAFSDNPKHLKRFGALNNEISHAADSLLLLMPSEQNEQRLREVERLIMRKGQISYVLSRQFYYYDPLSEINARLKAYTPPTPPNFLSNDSLLRWVKSLFELRSQKSEIEYLRQENAKLDLKIQQLTDETDSLEQFARETFLFAAPTDDVFIVEE